MMGQELSWNIQALADRMRWRLEWDRAFRWLRWGASAGGLEAFTEFLKGVPEGLGMAFVFIQHLAPGHESMLVHLLSRATGMTVRQAGDGMEVARGEVYVIPPDTDMRIEGDLLKLQPRLAGGVTIDVFLRSLAESRRGEAVAVILSGTGNDGSQGVRAIEQEGGVVLVQTPETARFDGMPRSAIATGCADLIWMPSGWGRSWRGWARSRRRGKRAARRGSRERRAGSWASCTGCCRRRRGSISGCTGRRQWSGGSGGGWGYWERPGWASMCGRCVSSRRSCRRWRRTS